MTEYNNYNSLSNRLPYRHRYTKIIFICIYIYANIFLPCQCSSSTILSTSSQQQQQSQQSTQQIASKLGVHMVRSPESTIAPLRDEVLFECELNLEPERLEWRFRSAASATSHIGSRDNYVYLNRNDEYNITTHDRTSKLRVYVSQNLVGEYQCIAWFGSSALASIPAKLMLASISLDDGSRLGENRKNYSNDGGGGSMMRRIAPPQIVHWKVQPGNSILIKCGDVISNPLPVWSFYKDRIPIPTSVPQLASGALILQSVTGQDSGTYLCSAVNSITGTEITIPQKVTLSVENCPKSAPYFLVTPNARFSVKPGATAILECPGIGNPIPKAVWSRPDAEIYNNRTTVLSYGLQIVNVNEKDGGTYVCRLDNGMAPVLVHTIRLDVQAAPIIVEGPELTLTNEGDRLSLQCLVKGYPLPEIYWMINGNDTRWDLLIRSNGTKLFIERVEKRHAGIVQCFARNDYGEVNFSNLLRVNPKQIPGGAVGAEPLGTFVQSTKYNLDHTGKPPKGRKKHKHTVMIPPSRPSVTRLSDDKVMVRWSVPPKEGLTIKFFKVQYRKLGDAAKKVSRSQWMTGNEDISPEVRMYEVDGLEPDFFYRFRIAAVYSNNDNKLSNVSAKFLLQRGSQLGPIISHLIAPNLTRVEAISETAVILHWTFPTRPTSPVDGFYAYYRPASTAGEYSKATVDGMHSRHFKIDHLEPGTAYEFKLQSFTSSAASDFLAIITGKTLKPSTPPPIVQDKSENETILDKQKSYFPIIAGAAGGGALLLLALMLGCVCMKRKRSSDSEDDANENKSHPDHIQAEPNGFIGSGNGRVISSPIHKSSRLNGVVPRINITSNPLAQDGDKNRNVMELRFLPNSLTAAAAAVAAVQQQQQNNNCPIIAQQQSSINDLSQQQQQQQQHHLQQQQQQQHRNRTLERTNRNLHYPITTINPNDKLDGLSQADIGRVSSMRRTRRSSGSQPVTVSPTTVPGSPRVIRGGVSSELYHNRSPMPTRAAAMASKRNRLGSRNENMSSGSLNSIEV